MKNFKEAQFQRYFQHQPYRSFNGHNLHIIFEKEKRNWGLKKSTFSEKILEYVLSQGLLTMHMYKDPYQEEKRIFTYETKDFHSVVSGIKSGSYITYLSAMKLHGLSTEKNKTVYLNAERSGYESPKEDRMLSQDTIDHAFASQPKESSNINSYKSHNIIITNGKRTDRLGVIAKVDEEVCYYYTDLERTLIDCVVRPGYAGGIKGVLKAFKKAKPNVDLLKLQSYLKRLNYTYPYEQCVGFYLDNAGYLIRDSSIFKDEFRFDFYLTHGMEYSQYNEKWKIFYPSEL